VRPKCEDGLERIEQHPTKPRSALSFRLVVGLSIPVYLLLTWIIAVWLPGNSFFALIPAVFALHSAAVLLSRRKE
jgi:hypothetical protein